MRAHEFISENRKIPFAGAKAGHKAGRPGQLKGKDPKGYPLGKLVGGEGFDPDVDEGWKDWVAGAAIGAAALGGSGDAEAAKKKPTEKPAVIQQVNRYSNQYHYLNIMKKYFW